MDLDVGIGLSVLEQDVVARLIALDQIALENQGFSFIIGDRELQAIDGFHQQDQLQSLMFSVKVTIDAFFQITRLADIEDLPIAVKKLIHTWLFGKILKSD